jgi:hypothetical protein
MARLIVKGPWLAEAEVTVDPETGHAEAICYCGWSGTDRGQLEDTLQLADIHVDHNCPRRQPAWAESEEK